MTTEPNLELIETYNIGQLRSVATQLGLDVEKTAKKAELLPRIRERLMTVQPDDKVSEQPKKEPEPVVVEGNVTEADIEQIAAQYQSLGFKYKVEDGVFYFKCRGKEDSGNMKQPRRVVEKVAKAVAQRGYAPAFGAGEDGGAMVAG